MLDLKEVLYGIARAIVDNPEEVTIISQEDGNNITLTLPIFKSITLYITKKLL